jgi:signal transduction histidine kinase/ligand-binding sensor domain-containing protein/DNA-binding response OmpR family regulator
MIYLNISYPGKVKVVFICLIVILTLNLCLASAQTPALKFKHITNEQGLSNSTIETIFQDSRGFMWFGTRDGLNRYDGHQMIVYRNNPNDNNSISDNFIFCITEDHQHKMWFGTKNGLNYFDSSTNTFTRYNYDPKRKNSLSDNQVSGIYEDKNNDLWVSTYMGGLNLFNPQKATFTHFKHSQTNPSSISSDMVTNLCEDSKGNFWITTRNGINLFNRSTQKFTPFQNLSDPERANLNNNFLNIQPDKSGNLWLGTEDSGLFLFNITNKTFRSYKHDDKVSASLGSDMIKSVLVDHKGQLWVGSINGGLDLFNPANGAFIHNQNTPADQTSLSQKTVSAIFEDNQSNLWVGTHRGGLNLYTPGANKFQLYRQEARPSSLGYYDVTAFCQDSKGRIWIGTDYGGLDLFDQQNNIFHHYRYDPYNNKSLSSDAVLDVMEDKSGDMWVSTWGGGVNLFNRDNGTFTRFLNNPQDKLSISSNHVQKTFQDSRGNLWVATYFGGLNRLNPKTHQFQRLVYDPSGKSRLYGNNIVALNEDKEQNLWIGTDDGGLNCYNLITQHFSHYFFNPGRKPDIRIIFNDNKGRLWIGHNGLYLFDPKKKTFFIYTERAGLSKEAIKGIIEDEHHDFWISTSNGLTKFNPETLGYKKFNIEDGLQDLEFEANACLKTKDGELFFGGVKGFNTFYPDQIRNNKFIPPVYITDFQIFNKSQVPGKEGSPLKYDISLTDQIILNHQQSAFSFTFAALNYTAPINNRYAYKLENFDKNWINAGNEQKASYTNLNAGEYVFRVRASNNDGLWNEKGASVKIVILPPFWSTWWFRLIFGAAGLFILYTWYESKRKRALKEMEERKKEEMHQVQLQFFTNISHEFRTPLSLILGPLEILKKENIRSEFVHYYNTIHRNANRLLNLINELMDFRKVEAGVLKLRVRLGNLGLFLNDIAEEFKDLTTQKQIEFSVTNTDQFDEVWFDNQILEKIILNLLNNSFKYTADGGKITLDVFLAMDDFSPSFENSLIVKNEWRCKKYFYIRVADNGIGISKESIAHLFERYYRITASHLGSGVGLAFVKSLAQLHKGDIYVYSERNKGTEIIIGLPLGIDNYRTDEQGMPDEGMVKLESLSFKPSQQFELSETADKNDVEITTAQHEEHILLVDDNDELRSFFKETLSAFYHIQEANNGEVGLEMARNNSLDLIISDIMMPVMDGIEFCRAIKNDIATSHIPFIMLTAKNALASKIEGAESGADIYFSKPASMELLLVTISNFFEQRQKVKNYYKRNYYAEARDLVTSSKDKDFMDKLLGIIDAKLINTELDVDYVCQEINMSRTKLYQKIKNITGQSIVEFIRSCRLKKAAKMMTHEDVSITEVMYRVGIQTQSHFTKSFKKEFGKTPSQFLQEIDSSLN